jgi:hypothetical protein
VSVEGGDGVQRLVLHGPTGRRAGAARTLVRWLAHDVRHRDAARDGSRQEPAFRLGSHQS